MTYKIDIILYIVFIILGPFLLAIGKCWYINNNYYNFTTWVGSEKGWWDGSNIYPLGPLNNAWVKPVK